MDPRPPLQRAPSVNSNMSTDTRKSSIILDMREAISESGKRLSSIVAENQTKAVEALIADMHGHQLTTKKKVVYGWVFVCLVAVLLYTCVWAWDHLILIRDSLTQQLSQLSLDQSSQLTQLTTRLGRLELLIEQLHTGGGGHQLDGVLQELRQTFQGNSLKVAVMDRLVEELESMETAINTLQLQVRESVSCGWNPLTSLLSSPNKPT